MRIFRMSFRGASVCAALGMVVMAGCDATAADNAADRQDNAMTNESDADDIVYPPVNEAEPRTRGDREERRGNREGRGMRGGADGEARELGELPAATADLSSTERAALEEARDIAERGESDASIETVEARGAVAWIEDGEVIRIAQSERGTAIYYRPGESTPFLMQRGQTVVFVTNGEIGRGMSGRGVAELEDKRLERATQMLQRAEQAYGQAARE